MTKNQNDNVGETVPNTVTETVSNTVTETVSNTVTETVPSTVTSKKVTAKKVTVNNRILIMAGGTGGHVMPALAVAEELRARGVEVVWVGAGGIENKIVPAAGFELKRIRMKGLRKSGFVRALTMPLMLTWACAQMFWIMLRTMPRAVLGMGGFVSAPGGLVAAVLKRPLVVHEQNAIAGYTNRRLAQYADRALTGFPFAHGMPHGAVRVRWVGNPVRRELAELPSPTVRAKSRESGGALRILVLGGSQGASVFNETLPNLLSRLQPSGAVEVLHQCGPAAAADIGARYLANGIACEVHGFIDDMARAYSWCDLLICRAGALTVAEICAAGVASILIPYPHAVNDHQTANAAYLQACGAAKLVPQAAFIRGDWLPMLQQFQNHRAELMRMAKAARILAQPDAAAEVAQICISVCTQPRRKKTRATKKENADA